MVFTIDARAFNTHIQMLPFFFFFCGHRHLIEESRRKIWEIQIIIGNMSVNLWKF